MLTESLATCVCSSSTPRPLWHKSGSRCMGVIRLRWWNLLWVQIGARRMDKRPRNQNKIELTSSHVNRSVLNANKDHHNRCMDLSAYPNHWFPVQTWVPLSIINMNQNKSKNMTKSVGTKVRHAQSVTGSLSLAFCFFFLTPFLGSQNSTVLKHQL